MNFVKHAAGLTAALLVGLCAASASAANLNYTLYDTAFDDGGTASGTFSVDDTTGAITAFDIVTTAGGVLPAFTYDTGNSLWYGNNVFTPNSFILVDFGFDRYINLGFVNPLTAGGIDPLAPEQANYTIGSWECDNCNNVRNVVSGFAAAPEPGAWALMLAGFAGLGAALRTKRKLQQITA
jgi:hypothetical protein